MKLSEFIDQCQTLLAENGDGPICNRYYAEGEDYVIVHDEHAGITTYCFAMRAWTKRT